MPADVEAGTTAHRPDESHSFDFEQDMDACYTAFDKDEDGLLDINEFGSLCRALFRNDRGQVYTVSPEMQADMFSVFDKNEDGFIDREEFAYCWTRWIKRIVRPVNVFLAVDVQNDFISGSLNISRYSAQQNGEEVIEPINALLDTVQFDAVFYSLDWHPSDHVSFFDNLAQRKLHSSSPVSFEEAKMFDTVVFEGPPQIRQKLWPRHCVQESWGAELHKDLKVVENSVMVYKGTNPEVDSYSVFWDNKKMTQTSLVSQLEQVNATDIYICGLAYDICVGATAADALVIGYRTILVDDCCRGVDLEDIERTKRNLVSNHGVIVNSSQVKAMVEGRDRRPELGYKLALELRNKEKKHKDGQQMEETEEEQQE
ncbi:uncharacterized protein Naam [Hetaerina americana]|uniref:uncharacterized protein Naam n=1 Tax=Hetaerina americana TaxID=62018 RepID=UPI003A7F540C